MYKHAAVPSAVAGEGQARLNLRACVGLGEKSNNGLSARKKHVHARAHTNTNTYIYIDKRMDASTNRRSNTHTFTQTQTQTHHTNTHAANATCTNEHTVIASAKQQLLNLAAVLIAFILDGLHQQSNLCFVITDFLGKTKKMNKEREREEEEEEEGRRRKKTEN